MRDALRRAHPWGPALCAGLRCAGHQLRPGPWPGEGTFPAPAGLILGGMAARIRRPRDLTVRTGAVRLPTGGDPAHPGRALTAALAVGCSVHDGVRWAAWPDVSIAGCSDMLTRHSGCGAAW